MLMRKTGIILLALMAMVITAKAQSEKKLRDEARVVIDSSGMKYPYAIWKKLMATHEYRLKKIDKNSDSSAYLLVKRDSAELDRYMSKIPLPRAAESFPVGKKVTYYKFKDIEGNTIKAEDLKGKIVVLNFWFMGCSPCRKEMPALNELAFEYAKQPDVVFIAIALDRKWDLQDFIKTHPLAYHIIDEGQFYADRYNVHLYPTNVVLSKDGQVLFSDEGFSNTTQYWLRKNIEYAKDGQ
jgi:thiol-disulfide isomerase/thioredoxin